MAPGGTSTCVPGPITSSPTAIGPRIGSIAAATSADTGPVRRTQTRPDQERVQVKGDGDGVRTHTYLRAAHGSTVGLRRQAGACATLREARHEHELPRPSIAVLVDGRGARERGGVGAGGERAARGERAPEVETDP